MNRHCGLFCALIVVPMQGTETTKFVAMDNGKNSMIQIIQTKNARIDEINKRTDLIKQCGYSKNVALRADLHLGANTVEYWKSHDAMPYHTRLLFVMAYNVTGIPITE